MEFNRAQLKREVKLSMKGSGCMMVTLLFGVVVSVGTWLLNTILGGMLTGGTGSVSETAVYYIQRGYDFQHRPARAVSPGARRSGRHRGGRRRAVHHHRPVAERHGCGL